jgi:hypothetical protein
MIQIKRTATYILRGVYTTKPGYPADLSGTTIACDVKLSDGQYEELDVQLDPDNVTFTLTANTLNWTTGVGQSDIKFVSNGLVWFTQTFEVEVVPNITR